MLKVIAVIFLVSVTVSMASGVMTVQSAINPINCILCRIINIMWGIVAGIATLVIMLAGLKWMGSAEDPGARAQAKTSIVHALVGLIIVIVSLLVIGWVTAGTKTAIDVVEFIPVVAGGNGCVNFCT